MKPMCPECGQEFAAKGGGHCRGGAYGGCCRTFTSNAAADKHRIGEFSVDRRCVADMDDDWRPGRDGALVRVPWRLTPRGWTPFAEISPVALSRKTGIGRV